MARSQDFPLVPVIHSQRIVKSYGVCGHVNFTNETYGSTEAWLQRADSLGATFFRSLYAHALNANDVAIAEARRLGLKWIATVTPEDWSQSDAELRTRLAHIRDNASDVVIAIEGVNEPNHERNGGNPPADWDDRTLHVQQVIWDYVQANMPTISVVGPSLHATVSTVYQDHVRLGNLGIAQYMDYAGLHRYAGGRYPDYLADERVSWIHKLWSSSLPVWVTETGYTNCINNTTGHKPVPENVSAAYGPLSILEWFSRGCKSTRYELLDDVNPAKDDVESNFGLWRTPSLTASTWTEKPEVSKVRAFLSNLADPGASFSPTGIRLKVAAPSPVKYLVVGKRDGSKKILFWQAASIFDPNGQKMLTPNYVNAVVQRPTSLTTVKVPAGVVVTHTLVP